MARIIELGGAPQRAERVAAMRREFEMATGAFAPEDPWFEERSRAFWCDVVTRRRFGREVATALDGAEQAWLGPFERAHRGLFRTAAAPGASVRGTVLVDVWSGAELAPTILTEESRAELDVGAEQLFDARVAGASDPLAVALLPGAIFHPPQATAAIEAVLAAAREASMSTDETLDALLRMERTLRSLSRVKPAYAYRPEALSHHAPSVPVRGSAKGLA